MPKALRVISFEEAQKIISVVIDQASKDGGSPVAVAILGMDGRLVTFAVMDGVMSRNIKLAQNKAHTAIVGKRDTIYWEGKSPSNFTDSSFICFGGGALLEVLSKIKGQYKKIIIGAIGVSGRISKQDQSLANRGKNEAYVNFGTGGW